MKIISDCDEEGCGKCDVCEYLGFIEWAQNVAPEGGVIERDEAIEEHLKLRNKHEVEEP